MITRRLIAPLLPQTQCPITAASSASNQLADPFTSAPSCRSSSCLEPQTLSAQGVGGTLVYGAAANCFSSHPIVAAPSRQGKNCQPSFYLVARVCALKEARSAPGGRRMKPQPPPPLPQSAVSLEGLKPSRGGWAAYERNRSWEGIWWKEEELGTNGRGCVCPETLSEPLALPAPAGPDKSRPYLLPKCRSLKGNRGSFTARLVPCRKETPSASAVPSLSKKQLSPTCLTYEP